MHLCYLNRFLQLCKSIVHFHWPTFLCMCILYICKYIYIIFTRCPNHPEILIPLYLPKHIICPQLVIVSPKVIIHSQKCSFTHNVSHIRCHLFYSFSSKWASSVSRHVLSVYDNDQTDAFMFWLSGVSYVICHLSFLLYHSFISWIKIWENIFDNHIITCTWWVILTISYVNCTEFGKEIVL